MATFLNDTFTDTNGTGLASHTGETGATWTQHPSFGVSVAIDSNRAHVVSSTFAVYYASGTPASADYDVTTTIFFVTTGSFYLASAGRIDTSANTHYWARCTNGSTELLKTVAGTTTSLGSGGGKSPTASSSHTITLSMSGTSISTKWDGAADISAVTDSAISAAGKAGLRFNSGTSSTGYHADQITAATASSTITGAVAATWTFAFAAAGTRKTFGALAPTWSFAFSAAGTRKTFGALAPTWTFVEALSGTRKTFGALSATWTFAEAVSGRRTTFGAVSRSVSFAFAVAGTRKTFGALAQTITFTPSVTGTRVAVGAVALPITFTFHVAPRSNIPGRIVVGFVRRTDRGTVRLGTEGEIARTSEGVVHRGTS